MIRSPTILVAIALLAGLLSGGCNNGAHEITKSLVARNAELENQVASGQHVSTALAVTVVVLACGLGVSLHHNLRRKTGGPDGEDNRRTRAEK